MKGPSLKKTFLAFLMDVYENTPGPGGILVFMANKIKMKEFCKEFKAM